MDVGTLTVIGVLIFAAVFWYTVYKFLKWFFVGAVTTGEALGEVLADSVEQARENTANREKRNAEYRNLVYRKYV